jgi:hypothetical protein
MERIENSSIEELCQALTRHMPTVEEIRAAMLLAYKVGKNDGELGATEKYANMLKASA